MPGYPASRGQGKRGRKLGRKSQTYGGGGLKLNYRQSRKATTNYKIPFPPFMKTQLKWAGYWNLMEAGTGTYNATVKTIRVNSLYDPSYTETTGTMVNSQPMFFDQLAGASAPYTKYLVKGMKYEVQFANPASQDAFCVVRPTAGVHIPDVTDPKAMWVEEQRLRAKKYTLVRGAKSPVIKGYIDVASIYGVSKDAVRDDDTFASEYNDNPQKAVQLNILVTNADGTIGQNYVPMNVKCTYYVHFFDRNILNYS